LSGIKAEQRPVTVDDRRLWLASLVIAGATLLVVLDSTIVNVAVPAIKTAFGFSTGGVEWVVSSYLLTFGGLLLLGGRTGDFFGRRRMFMVGIAVFTGASLLAGFAPTQGLLIAARALQGTGAAIVSPTSLSLIATTFPEGAARNRAMGVYAAMSGSGGAIGLVLGGFLTSAASWRWVFFVAVPIGAIVLLVAPRVLPESSGGKRGRLDLPGAITVTGGMALLVYGLIEASQDSWTGLVTLVSLGGGVLLLIAFGVIESRSARPLVPPHIVLNRNRSAIYLIMMAAGCGLYGMMFLLMLFIQNDLGFGAIMAGVGFLPLAGAISVMSAVMAKLVNRIGTRIGVTVGPLIGAAGMFWLYLEVGPTAHYAQIVWPTVVIALGLGATFVPLTLAAISGVRPNEAGVASALANTSQQIGGSIGLAVLGTVSTIAAATSTQPGRIAAVAGYHAAFGVAAIVLVAAFVIALLMVRGSTAPRAGLKSDRPG
jgi:EmrB/QacA subfamily drug resistance transporter